MAVAPDSADAPADPRLGQSAPQKNRGNAGKGRQKGSRNKTTAILKDAILQAAEQAGGAGGTVAYLKDQAERNPGPFLTLLGKVLPLTLAGDPDNPLKTVTRIERVIIDPEKPETN